MLFYDYFYKKFGIRLPAQLMTPIMSDLETMELPRNSLYHFRNAEIDQIGPSDQDPIFKNLTKPIMVEHIQQLIGNEGNPKLISTAITAQIRKFHASNRRFKLLKDVSIIKDQLSLIVLNYSPLGNMYRYIRSVYTDYYRWKNMENTTWYNVAKIANETDRHQFIVMDLPVNIPTLNNIVFAETAALSNKLVKLFPNDESRFILEVWKWIGHNRKDSILSHLTYLNYHKVSLIFIESGKWFTINLGVLNNWRKPSEEELKQYPDLKDKGLDPKQLQKYFLRLLMAATSLRSGSTIDPEVMDLENNPIVQTDEQEEQLSDDRSKVISVNIAANKTLTTIITKTEPLPTEAKLASVTKPVAIKDDVDITDIDLAARVNQDLEQLERISKAIEQDNDNTAKAIDLYQRDTTITLETAINKYCNELADSSRISAKEYQRFNELAKSYKKIKSPDNKTTLEHFVKISKEDLAIPKVVVPDNPNIFDKSMLESSLLSFDRDYITKNLQKDVAACVLNLQNAGIAITNYDIEHVETIMGEHDNYSVQLVPVNGKPSTIKFTLPSVDEHGEWEANGSKYKLRKQIGDYVLHKIAPNRVALTSYYGKLFVSRSEKKVNDYSHWLANKIMLMGMDDNDNRVTNVNPGNVFDHLFECPKLYSTLAQSFITLVVNDGNREYYLNFNHAKREEHFTTDVLKLYETDGCIVVGMQYIYSKSSKPIEREYLVLDKNSNLFKAKDGIMIPTQGFENLIGLDTTGSPTEFITMKVMGQDIPVGIILAYELGLNTLIASLKAQCRRVEAGKRLNLMPTEYCIVFEDETLIFDKSDTLASLILAGFNEYKQAIKLYSSHEFNNKHVYVNVLESYKLGTRYIKEIKLIYELFIDPITKELLEELGEPTTFRGILMRACEMLEYDYHPDEVDPAHMRKKGYERFAGAVYSEIIKAIRVQRSRIDGARAPIELNPLAVWMNISQDPSKVLVSEINPIQNLKEVEAVTFAGVGGRNSRSMVKRTRIYHPNDMGTISESTVDSGDVAINVFTSANPLFTSQRGLSARYEHGKTGVSSLLSTSALLAPAVDRED